MVITTISYNKHVAHTYILYVNGGKKNEMKRKCGKTKKGGGIEHKKTHILVRTLETFLKRASVHQNEQKKIR